MGLSRSRGQAGHGQRRRCLLIPSGPGGVQQQSSRPRTRLAASVIGSSSWAASDHAWQLSHLLRGQAPKTRIVTAPAPIQRQAAKSPSAPAKAAGVAAAAAVSKHPANRCPQPNTRQTPARCSAGPPACLTHRTIAFPTCSLTP